MAAPAFIWCECADLSGNLSIKSALSNKNNWSLSTMTTIEELLGKKKWSNLLGSLQEISLWQAVRRTESEWVVKRHEALYMMRCGDLSKTFIDNNSPSIYQFKISLLFDWKAKRLISIKVITYPYSNVFIQVNWACCSWQTKDASTE